MLSIRSRAAMAHALSLPIDADLMCLLRRRVDQLNEHENFDLGELAYFVIVQAGDSLPAIEAELGFSPLTNFVDGSRYGDPDFEPSWEWIADHGGWFELIFVMSDDGFGHVLFVENSDGVDPELLSLCRHYSTKPQPRILSSEAEDSGSR